MLCYVMLCYTTSLSQVITNHNLSHHLYADDTQVCISLSQSNAQESVSALRGFKSYFSDRYQSINISSTLSCPQHLPFRVPQGSVLCLAYILHLSAKSLLIIISVITCMPMTHRFTYHFYNHMHKNLFRL